MRVRIAELTLLLDIPRCAAAPPDLKCPLSGGLLIDPVQEADGQIFDRQAIAWWVNHRGRVSPITGKALHALWAVHDRALAHRVAQCTPDPAPPLQPDSTEVRLRIVRPQTSAQFHTFRLDSTLRQVADRINPAQRKVVTGDGLQIYTTTDATLGQCRIQDGTELYFPLE
jgi:hypothetical protein